MKRILLLIAFLSGAVSAQDIGARYLVITDDDFYDAVQPLVQWKHKKGMRTKTAKLSEIGHTADSIRNYIVNAYNNWQIPPEFLLLVGAPNYLPFGIMDVTTDNYYTDINNDIFNDILSGRLTVHTANETETVVNKILLYEKNPDLTDSTWFIDACLIVREDIYDPYDDSIYWSDINHAKNYMRTNGYDTIDTLSRVNGNSTSDILQAVNEGCAFVLYRGQGVNNWWSPFDVNPDLTNNGNKLPIVLSITCSTISTSSYPAVAEKWLLTGTPANPRGGAGFFATTTVVTGHADYRSAVAKGFFDGIFRDKKRTFGEACETGRLNVYSLYSASSEYRGFTTLGDPEMNIWTATPCSIVVAHPPVVTMGYSSFSVGVSMAHNSVPVESAYVCVMGTQDTAIYQTEVSDVNGNAYFDLSPMLIGDTMHITVTGRNLKPYEGQMLTVATDRYVAYLKSEIDDSLGGNNDGVINPGEEITVPLWVKNYGDSTAMDVTGAMQSDDPYITVVDSIRTFGNITGGDSAFTGEAGYRFLASPDTPDNRVLNFDLTCSDENDSVWISHFNAVVHTAILEVDSIIIEDINGNGSFEPAESATVVVALRNTGSTAIDAVSAQIQTSSQYITIIDSSGTFPHIGPDSSGTNILDPFVIFADSSTPYGTAVNVKLMINSGYYIDTLAFAFRVGIFVPTDTGYYYAYYSGGAHEYSPTFDWVAIDSTQTANPGISLNLGNDQTIVVALPFDFTYYGIEYDSISICSNGWIALGYQTMLDPSNSAIPNADGPAAMIAGIWDDLDPGNSGQPSDVYYYYDATQHRFIVEYFRVEHWPSADHETFEIILLDPSYYATPTGDGEIIVQYLSAMQQGDNTIGIENGSETIGIQYFLNEVYDTLAKPVTDSFALRYTTHRPDYLRIEELQMPAHMPKETMLAAVHPNPFTHRSILKYSLSAQSIVLLRVYDVAGRAVRTLVHDNFEPGLYTTVWDACDDSGSRLPAGVYFISYFVEAVDGRRGHHQVEKTILVRQ
ncbi:MAG: C25 family cysteine peptidase [candidate division WOR-3 bacterium]|nr:C25 family cysteine peptidase [candidate division WOR-3 bacterium]